MREQCLRASDHGSREQAAAEQERIEPRLRYAAGFDVCITLSRDETAESLRARDGRVARRWQREVDRGVQRRNGDSASSRRRRHPAARQRLTSEAEEQQHEAEAWSLKRA